MFDLKPDVILFSLEGKRVTGGVAEDYIKGNQKTAYLTILLDTSYSQPIRCFIKYANLLRTVTANPSATFQDVVSHGFRVNVSFRCLE